MWHCSNLQRSFLLHPVPQATHLPPRGRTISKPPSLRHNNSLSVFSLIFNCNLAYQNNPLKSDSHLPKNLRVICLIESPLKVMKNAFCFVLKTLFVLKIFKFLSRPFGRVEKKAWSERCLTLKFMTSQPGLQTIAIDILPNISQSEGNQIMNLVN